MKQIRIKIDDRFGEYSQDFRQEILERYRMHLPHHVVLHFPDALVSKALKAAEFVESLHATSVKFGLFLRESKERPLVECFDRDDVLIPVTQYEEAGLRDTISEFTLEYHWLYKSFCAQLIYVNSYSEFVFYTSRFKLM